MVQCAVSLVSGDAIMVLYAVSLALVVDNQSVKVSCTGLDLLKCLCLEIQFTDLYMIVIDFCQMHLSKD